MTSSLVLPEGSSSDPVTAPGLEEQQFVAPLADAYRRLDPSADGWESEALSQAAQDQLNRLAGLFESRQTPSQSSAADVVAAEFACAGMRPQVLDSVLTDEAFRVRRGRLQSDIEPKLSPVSSHFVGPQGFLAAYQAMMAGCGIGTAEHVKFKITRVQIDEQGSLMEVLFHANGMSAEGPAEISAQWHTRWRNADGTTPQLLTIQLTDYEEVIYQSDQQYVYVDGTESLLSGNASYRQQILRGTDYWRDRIPKVLGIDVVGNHGLAVGDLNGDDLDDLYICQQGGLPNRLYLQQPDGTLVDATEMSGADWLDYCASALIVDLDNDGDGDLIVGQETRILFMANDGQGRFQLRDEIASRSQTFSLSAADYDLDGDVDVYACGYNPSVSDLRTGVMGEPMPYHDANNGGQSILIRNEGQWQFVDVTDHVGLSENNRRFSFAASWEDFDNDGDQDLYVANDYGRNNLYLNQNGQFRDVAATLGVEDMSAGMSASWADFNRDGWMDLYVSNMFSAAGNRITYQRQFKAETEAQVKQQFQRHARGNTLFTNSNGQEFNDISEAAGVTMGRWAWGSKFVDLNSDGWEDLVVANGFITTDDTGDL